MTEPRYPYAVSREVFEDALDPFTSPFSVAVGLPASFARRIGRGWGRAYLLTPGQACAVAGHLAEVGAALVAAAEDSSARRRGLLMLARAVRMREQAARDQVKSDFQDGAQPPITALDTSCDPD